ncbi:MAG TPA: hypothetical protein VKP30_23630, partial [Polyangiaceae bacterium]|nr:hypothetical protein [Polyangiaceae bacterium]
AAIEGAPPGLTLIKAECGIGKTQAALRVAARRAAKPYADPNATGARAPLDSKTAISVDKNNLAIQCTRSLEAMQQSSLRLFGPLSLRDERGQPVCQYHEVGDPLVAGGQRIQWELCVRRNGEVRCPHFDRCPAKDGQEGDPSSRITVGTHSLLGALDAETGSTGLLVIDEVQDFLETVGLTESDLDQALNSAAPHFDGMFVAALTPALLALRSFLRSALQGERLDACEAVRRYEREVPLAVLQQAQRSASVSADADAVDCALGAPFPHGHRGYAPPILKMTVDHTLYQPKLARKVGNISRVLKAVHHAISSEHLIIVRVEPRGNGRVLLVTSPREMLARALRRSGAVVVTDANADYHLPVLAKVVGYQPPMHVFTAPDGAPIERTLLRTGNATRKAWFKNGQLDLGSSLIGLVKAVIDWARQEPPTRVLGIITVPLVETMLRFVAGIGVERCRETWASMKQPSGALDAFSEQLAPCLASWSGTLLTAHYGATRGMNDMADADALVTLGDPWMNLGDAQNDAAFLGLADEWEARYEARCRAELEQAHGRLRTVHRTRPGRALHVGAVMPSGSGWASGRVHERHLERSSQIDQAEARANLEKLVQILGSCSAVGRELDCSRRQVERLIAARDALSPSLAERVQAILSDKDTLS